MPLEFVRNTLLITKHTAQPKISNICYVFPSEDKIALVERSTGYIRRPAIKTVQQLRQAIHRKTFQIHEEFNNDLITLDDETIPERYRRIRDERYAQIKPIVEKRDVLERYLLGSSPMYLLEEIVKTQKVSLKHLYHLIHRYLAFGGVVNALLPDYKKCGTAQTLPVSEKKPGPKRGRPPIYSRLHTRNWTEADSIFLREIFWPKLTGKPRLREEDIYLEFCLQRFGEAPRREKDGKYIYTGEARKKIVSAAQFYYHLARMPGFAHRILQQKGTAHFDNNAKAITKSARHDVRGAGELYQIDATTAAINLLYSKCDAEVISCGRPTLYLVIDVFSTMIVGFYVSLHDPHWSSVAEALFNAFMPKDEFLNEFYGRKHRQHPWPSFGVPLRLGMDRDPAHSAHNLEALLSAKFGIEEAEIYPAFRGSAKGINERAIGHLERKNKTLPGARNENTAIDQPHPSNEALYTYRDYVKALIREVIRHNNHSFKSRLLDAYTVKVAAGASPREIWTLTHANYLGRRVQPSADHIRFGLLREETAVMTAEGISFRNRFYVNPKLRDYFVAARFIGREPIKIRMTSTTTNYIWYMGQEFVEDAQTGDVRPKNILYRCELSEKSQAFCDATEFEAGMLDESLKHKEAVSKKRQYDAKKRDRREQNDEEEIMKARRRGLKKSTSAGIHKHQKKARRAEQAAEDARIADDLASLGADMAPHSDVDAPVSSDDPFDAGVQRMRNQFNQGKKR